MGIFDEIYKDCELKAKNEKDKLKVVDVDCYVRCLDPHNAHFCTTNSDIMDMARLGNHVIFCTGNGGQVKNVLTDSEKYTQYEGYYLRDNNGGFYMPISISPIISNIDDVYLRGQNPIFDRKSVKISALGNGKFGRSMLSSLRTLPNALNGINGVVLNDIDCFENGKAAVDLAIKSNNKNNPITKDQMQQVSDFLNDCFEDALSNMQEKENSYTGLEF